MDLRDNTHDQLVAHVATLRQLASRESPAALIWAEMQRVLNESALHLELFVIPKVEPVKQHLDLLGRNPEPQIAAYVSATTLEARDKDETQVEATVRELSRSFLPGNGKVKA